MSPAPRFLFDECLGKPSVAQLQASLRSTPNCAHLCDFFASGTLDNDWIPQIATEGGWIVITSDAGRKTNKGGKLPRLCKEFGITHVILTAALHRKPAAEKVAALVLAWDRIEALAAEPAGSRFKLGYWAEKGRKAPTLKFRRVD